MILIFLLRIRGAGTGVGGALINARVCMFKSRGLQLEFGVESWDDDTGRRICWPCFVLRLPPTATLFVQDGACCPRNSSHLFLLL